MSEDFSLTFYFRVIDAWFLARSSVMFRDVLSELNYFFLVFVSRVQEEPGSDIFRTWYERNRL